MLLYVKGSISTHTESMLSWRLVIQGIKDEDASAKVFNPLTVSQKVFMSTVQSKVLL